MLDALRRPRDRFTVALLLIALGALAWRILYVFWMRDLEVTGDGFHYHTASLLISDGHGFVNPLNRAFFGQEVQDAIHPPAWTLTLTASSLLGGRSYLTHQLISVVIGTATVVMTGLAGREAFGRRAGLIAAALAAVYANIWLYERELLSEPLVMLGVATIILIAYRFVARPGVRGAVLLGALVGLLALTRAELIALGPLLVMPLILGRSELTWSRRVGWLAGAGAACIALIAPWAIFNSTRFDRPVPLSTGLGNAMGAGNCNPTYDGELLGYAQWACFAFYEGISEDPSVADYQYREIAIEFMGDNLSDQPKVIGARWGRTFSFFRPGQQMTFDTERGTDLWVIELGTYMYWVLLPFAIGGVVIARRRRVKVYPLLVFPLVVVIAVTFTIGAVRYRAPAEIPFVLLASVAIERLIARWRRGSRDRSDRSDRGERLVLGSEPATDDGRLVLGPPDEGRSPASAATGSAS